MDNGWVCGACYSINRPGTSHCYSCRQSRVEAEAPSVEIPASTEDRLLRLAGVETPASAENSLLSLGGTMTMVCPDCGTRRRGWSSNCRSCGLSFDDLAFAQALKAASRGPGPLARLLLRRLPVIIPGLLLLVLWLVVTALFPSK